MSIDTLNKWFIAIRKRGKVYYVTEVDKDSGIVTWTPKRSEAISFSTESGVYNFLHAFLNDRTDVYLVHGPE